MKSVLISVRPKWCEKIFNKIGEFLGKPIYEKGVEVRKTRPKIDVPFKCYIYCTKDNTFAEKILRGFDENGKAFYYKANKGKVIGEFVCDSIRCEKEVADGLVDVGLISTSCVSAIELLGYANGNVLYSWHISDLVIYDKPRELREFSKAGFDHVVLLKRPPQSWCYVEEVK